MKKIVIASNNLGKLNEIGAILAPLEIEIVAQSTLGVTEAEEPHFTFVENALAKAFHASRATGLRAWDVAHVSTRVGGLSMVAMTGVRLGTGCGADGLHTQVPAFGAFGPVAGQRTAYGQVIRETEPPAVWEC